jgi:hypothetical protein
MFRMIAPVVDTFYMIVILAMFASALGLFAAYSTQAENIIYRFADLYVAEICLRSSCSYPEAIGGLGQGLFIVISLPVLMYISAKKAFENKTDKDPVDIVLDEVLDASLIGTLPMTFDDLYSEIDFDITQIEFYQALQALQRNQKINTSGNAVISVRLNKIDTKVKLNALERQ